MTKTKSSFLALVAVLLSPMAANAVPITIADFSGSETVETFDDLVALDPISNPFTLNGNTYTSLDSFLVQAAGELFFNIAGASLGTTVNSSGAGVFDIDFSAPANRAGLLLSSATLLDWDITVFGAGGVELETMTLFQPSDGDAVFAGFFREEGIERLSVSLVGDPTGAFTFFDDVRYESVSVPEPGTLALLGFGLFGMGLARRRNIRCGVAA